MQLHKLTCSYASLHGVTWAFMQVHELVCNYLSLHVVTWACMKCHELSWSFVSLHAVSWACMQFLSLSEQLTRFSQCLFFQNDSEWLEMDFKQTQNLTLDQWEMEMEMEKWWFVEFSPEFTTYVICLHDYKGIKS